jgi:CD63 antigen
MVSGGMKCIKYLLFLFNLAFFIAGLLLIVAGVLVQTKFNADFAFFEGQNINHIAILLIGVGVIIFTIGFFGCCGAYKESHCMVLTFSILLGIVFVVEIGAAITAHMMRTKIDKLIRDTMMNSIQLYPKGKAVKEAWDGCQQNLQCCGAMNFTDWADSNNLNKSVPDSCCVHWKEECGRDVFRTGNYSNVFHQGCADRFLEASLVAVVVVVAIAVAIAIMQILGVVVACFLAASIRTDNYQPL